MRFLVAFVFLAVIASAVMAYPAEVEVDQQEIDSVAAEANQAALLAVDDGTGHENESERQARQFGYGRGYGGYGGYGRGYGGYGGYGRGGYGGYGRGGYGGYGGYGRGGYYG